MIWSPFHIGIICVFQMCTACAFLLFEHFSIVFPRVVFAMEFTTLTVSVGYSIIHLSSNWPFLPLLFMLVPVLETDFSVDCLVYRRINYDQTIETIARQLFYQTNIVIQHRFVSLKWKKKRLRILHSVSKFRFSKSIVANNKVVKWSDRSIRTYLKHEYYFAQTWYSYSSSFFFFFRKENQRKFE